MRLPLTLLLLIFFSVSCSRKAPVEEPETTAEVEEDFSAKYERERKATRLAAETKIDELATKNGAIPDRKWREQFSKYGVNRYSIEVQDAVAALKGRPIVIVATMVDLFRSGGKHYMICADAYGHHFLLTCSEEIAKAILSKPFNEESFGMRETYAVVAKLKRVEITYDQSRRVELGEIAFHELEFSVYGDEVEADDEDDFVKTDAEENAEIKEGILFPELCIKGECVEASFLEGIDQTELSLFYDQIIEE